MKDIDLAGIYLQDIKNFLLAAELLNYSAVGRIMDITPSAVTKSINRLEQSTNLILFSKHSGKIRLTPAGRSFQNDLKEYISTFEKAATDAHYLQEGINNGIRIGVPNESNMPSVFPYIRELQKKYGNKINVSVEVHEFKELRNKIMEGTLDVIITVLFETDSFENTDIKWKLVQPVNLCIFVPDSNPLAKRKRLTIKDLRNEKFIVQSQSMTTGYLKLINNLCKKNGFTPLIGRYADNLGSFITALFFGEGILIGDELMKPLFAENVKCYPIPGTKSGQVVAWNSVEENRLIKDFVKMCKIQTK